MPGFSVNSRIGGMSAKAESHITTLRILVRRLLIRRSGAFITLPALILLPHLLPPRPCDSSDNRPAGARESWSQATSPQSWRRACRAGLFECARTTRVPFLVDRAG